VEHDIAGMLMREHPSFHVGGTRAWNALPGSLRSIERLVSASDRTVETGCGASTVVFAARESTHTVVSPDVREHSLVHAYCVGKGIDDSNVTYVAASSDRVLPTLCTGRELDFAFVDGAHSFPYPVVDFHFVARHLKVGGRLLLDDIPIPAVAPAYRFLKLEAHWRVEEILDDRAALCQLLSEPPPEDYNAQRFNRHPDYSFASPPHRIRIRVINASRDARTRAARRFPALRDAWKSVQGRRG
jgi:hypothetical protein